MPRLAFALRTVGGTTCFVFSKSFAGPVDGKGRGWDGIGGNAAVVPGASPC